MTSRATPIPFGPDGRPVYRRDHTKADGRPLRLYGYAPHTGDALPEDADEVAKGGESTKTQGEVLEVA